MPPPHRLLQKLLHLVLPERWAEDALGDLREEFLEWRRSLGTARATLRFCAEGLGLVRHGLTDHARHLAGVARELPATLRRHLRRPAIPVVGALALGPVLGAVGAFGSILLSALAGPLPHVEPDRLVVVSHEGGGLASPRQSEALHLRYAADVSALEPLGLFHHLGANVVSPTGARRVPVVRATAAALRAVGATAEAGRLLDVEDDRSSAAVLLTHRVWMAWWGGDPAVVGREVVVAGEARTIVGVLAPGIRLPGPVPDLVLSAGLYPGGTPPTTFVWTGSVGRLTDGADVEGAAEGVQAAFRAMAREHPRLDAVSRTPGGIGPSVVPVRRSYTRHLLPSLAVGFGASALLLVLTVAAALTLLLSVSGDRTHRRRVQRALGATTARLRAEAALESVATLGGAFAVGALTAAASVRGLGAAISVPLESWTDPAGAASTALASGLCVVIPAAILSVGRSETGRPGARSWHSTGGSLLLGTQAAAAVLLLTALAGSARSAWTLAGRDLGFETAELLTFGVVLPNRPYRDHPRRSIELHDAVKAGLLDLPEVEAVSYGLGVPVSHPGWATPWEVDRAADTTEVPPSYPYRRVAGDYFGVLGIPLLAGRPFDAAELSGARPAAMVNEAFARAHWRSPEGALGRRLRPAGSSRWVRVVGVVGNTADLGAAAPAPAMIYEPVTPLGDPRALQFMQYVVRGPSLGEGTVASARRIVAGIDGQVPAFAFETGESLVQRDTARERLALTFLAATTLVGLLSAALGLGGLVLLAISRRRREIGVRKALGGTDARLRRHSLASVWRPVTAGMVAGVLLVAAGVRMPAALLHDAATWREHAGVALLVLIPVLLATGHLGSRHVLRIEPATALSERDR